MTPVAYLPVTVVIKPGYGDHGTERRDADVGIIALDDNIEQEVISFG